MSSILTNASSMVALQTMKSINKSMSKVQDEISTGLKVATAKDGSATWSIASTMNSDVSSFKKLSESLASASEMVGTFRKAAEDVAKLLPKAFWKTPAEVAVAAMHGLDKNRGVIIPGALNRASAALSHLTPRNLLLPFVARSHPGLK